MRKSILLVVIFLAQIANPTVVTGQTNPPQGTGDWTIPSSDVTYFNNSQTLIQGNIDVYGTLIINDSNVYLWGSNSGDRDFIIHDGGEVIITDNSIISSYTNTCFDFTLKSGGKLTVDNSRIQWSCEVYLRSANWSITNSWFEHAPVEVNLYETMSTYFPSNGTTIYEVNHTFSNNVLANSSATNSSGSTALTHSSSSPDQIDTKLRYLNTTIVLNSYAAKGIYHYNVGYNNFEYNVLDVSTLSSTPSRTSESNSEYFVYLYACNSCELSLRNFSLHDSKSIQQFKLVLTAL